MVELFVVFCCTGTQTKTNPNARIEELNVNVIRTGINRNKPGGIMFKCCPHCTYLLDGFEVISEVPKVGR